MTRILRRLRRNRRAGAIAVALLMIGALVAFVAPEMSGAVVTGSPSSFESSDGNLTVNTAGNTDWNCLLGAGAPSDPVGLGCKTGANPPGLVTQHPGSTEGTGEPGWKPGQKLDAACPAIITKSSVPNKDDFTDIAQYNEEDTQTPPHTYIYGAEIRSTANGSSSGNLELNQQLDPAGKCQIFRTAGDRLIAFDFQGGGTTLAFHALTWITVANPTAGGNTGTCDISNDTPPCWGANVLTSGVDNITVGGCGTTGNTVEGCSNQSTIGSAANGLSNSNLAVNQFAEFGVDLTKALNLTGCFPVTQEVWESRSSGSSFTSNPEDIEILNHPINNCGDITIIKHTDPRGVDQSFQFSAPGLTPNSFPLNDSGNKTGDNAANTQVYSGVPAGSYTITETEASGFTPEGNVSCTDAHASGTTFTNATGTAVTVNLTANGEVTCTYVNQQNTASLSTAVNDAAAGVSVFPGTSVSDTATIVGSQSADTPSGTVTFALCGPNPAAACTSAGTSVASGTLGGASGTATATSGNVNTSDAPLQAGVYCFYAAWIGDSNYPAGLTEKGGPAITDPECFTVKTIKTTTMTSPTSTSLSNGTVPFGSQVSDHALIAAVTSGGGYPSGTVQFYVCTPTQVAADGGTCSTAGGTASSSLGTPVNTVVSNPVTDPPSSTADSIGTTVNATGTWCFAGVYTPGGVNGANYTGSNDATVDECFTVNDTTGATSTQNWLPNDVGSVSSVNGAPLNGSLKAQLYTGDNCGVTSGALVAGQLYTQPLSNASSPATVTTNNTSYLVTTSSSVSWLITFTSSDPNVAGTSHCESTSLTINNHNS